MDKYNVANELLEERELKESTIGELVSSGVIGTVLGPLAATVLGIFFGVTSDITKTLNLFKNKDERELDAIGRVKVKLSRQLEKETSFYKSALTKLAQSKALQDLNDVSLEISKKLKLSKEEFVALHDYLLDQRNKLQNVSKLVND